MLPTGAKATCTKEGVSEKVDRQAESWEALGLDVSEAGGEASSQDVRER